MLSMISVFLKALQYSHILLFSYYPLTIFIYKLY